MAVDLKLKEAVKAALLEIEADKRHAGVHSEIIKRMNQSIKPGMSYMTECGVCGKIITLNKPKWQGEITLV